MSDLSLAYYQVLGLVEVLFSPLVFGSEKRVPWWWAVPSHDDGVIGYFRIPKAELRRFDEHYQRGLLIAYRITGNWDEAHEAVCTTTVNIHQAPREPDNFAAYFDVAVRNNALRIVRRRRNARDAFSAIARDAALPSAYDQAVRNEAIHRVRCAIASLPSAQRDAISLVDLSGFSIPDAAVALGITVAATSCRLHRGRAALKSRLIGELEAT